MFKKRARRIRRPTELLLVPMIDIFTVLVTFLLMTAVFSRITIVELDLPSSASGEATAPTFPKPGQAAKGSRQPVGRVPIIDEVGRCPRGNLQRTASFRMIPRSR